MSIGVLNDIVAGRAPEPLTFTVDQFHKMIDDGIVMEGQAVELIDGVVMQKNRSAVGEAPTVHGRRHAVAIARIQRRLQARLENRDCHVRTQLPLTLTSISEPEPDIAVAAGAEARYLDHHPGPNETLVLIEVADSSLDYDRKTKCELYAASGVGCYWIINLVDDEVEVYEAPLPSQRRYARQSTHKLGDCVRLHVSDEVSIDLPVDDLVPSKK